MKKIISLLTIVLLSLTIVGCRFIKNIESNDDYLKSTETITVTNNDYYYVFKPKKYNVGIIFLGKENVDVISYAPLLHSLADKGYATFLLKDLVVNGKNSADVALASYDNIGEWYIGGHASGGTEAANYLGKNHLKYNGLFLLASYSEINLSFTELKFLSVYGDQDKILNIEKYNTNLKNLGSNFITHIIGGGNHSYFYNDTNIMNNENASITKKEQRELTINYIIELINQTVNGSTLTPDKNDIPTNIINAPVGENVSITNDGKNWNVSYNINDKKSHVVSFEISNPIQCDTLYLKLNAPKNTNLGIKVYNLDSNNQVSYKDIKDYNSSDGLLTTDGEQEFIFHLTKYSIAVYKIIKIELYLDCPSSYTINNGEVTVSIDHTKSELLNYSTLVFDELNYSLETVEYNYSGEPINLKINCNENVSFKIEYSEVVNNFESIWTTNAPTNVGEYNVRITYSGSLKYDYKIITSTIKINKIKAQINTTDISIDDMTRIITLNSGIVASLDKNFSAGYEVLNGVQIPYGTTIYYKNTGDDNHTESESLSLTFNKPLSLAKTEAISEIIKAIGNYDIDKIIYEDKINNTSTLEQVKQELLDSLASIANKKALIDAAITLSTAKDNAKKELSNYKTFDLYREAEQILLTNSISLGITSIDNAASIDEVYTALENAKSTIDNIKTKAQYEAEESAIAQALAKAKNDAIAKITETIGTYDIDKTSYVNSINSATSINEVESILTSSLKDINSKIALIVATQALAKTKNDAIAEITEIIGTYDIDKTAYVSSINSATSIDEVETLLNSALTEITSIKGEIDKEEAMKVKISDITSDTNATIIKNSKNEQIIQYNKSFGYHTFDIQVQNWNSSLSELKIIFTLSANTEVCFDINGKINWSYGHEELTGGIQHTKTFNSTDYPLAESFIIKIYFDAEVEVTENKIVTIHYIGFGEYVPEEVEKPEGTVTVNYEESVETFVNPDRGFYYPICLTAESTGIEQLGSTSKQIFNNNLIHLRIDIAAFSKAYNQNQDLELTTEMLNGLDAILTTLNNAGVCIIIRFAYDRDFGGAVDNEPDINMILKHIEQFSPLINKHKNMITAVECGLVGPWGEMHSSVIANQTTYNKIFAKYLECLDEDVVLLVRRPCFIYEYYGLTVNELDKFDYENNRIGCYNDGYLGSASDLGTFVDREKEIAFLEKLAKFPYGGEVVRPESEYNHLSWACDEMFRTNLSYLNIQWNNIVIDRWQNTEYTLDDPLYKGQTEFTYIANHMGYRLVCESLNYIVDDNNILNFTLNIKNVGFGELLKPKKGFVILRDGLTEHVFEFDYNNELTIEQQIDLSNIDSGVYEFFFVLADDYNNSHAVRGIRFANTNMYDESNHSNKLANIVI